MNNANVIKIQIKIILMAYIYILKELVGLRISVTVQGRRYRSLVRSLAYGSSSTGELF